MIRFLVVTAALFGAAAHGQTASPWIGTATDGAPRPPPAVEACSWELGPLLQEARKRGGEIRAASEQHAPSSTSCKALGMFIEAEDRLILFLQSKTECQTPFMVLDQLKTGHAKTERIKERVCSTPELEGLGLTNLVTEPPPSKSKLIGDFRTKGRWW